MILVILLFILLFITVILTSPSPLIPTTLLVTLPLAMTKFITNFGCVDILKLQDSSVIHIIYLNFIITFLFGLNLMYTQRSYLPPQTFTTHFLKV